MSESNRVQAYYIKESTYGVTPTTGAWQDIRFTDLDIAGRPITQISNEIRSDRIVQDLNLVGQEVQGNMGFELSMSTFDDWLESLLGDTWTANVIKVGTTEDSYTIEVAFNDWTTVQYLQFKGVRIGSMSLNTQFGQIVTGSFGLQGKEALQSTTSLVQTAQTITAKTSGEVVNGSSDVTSINIDGGAPGSSIRSINLTIDNTLRPIEEVGTLAPVDQAYGRCRVSGQIEQYFDDIAMYTKLLANTAAGLDWTFSDGSNTLKFDMNSLKFTDGVPGVPGVDTDVMLPLNFEAIYDSGDSSNIVITRT